MSTAKSNSLSPQNSPGPKPPKGVMNCKPCQVRKIKCDRALPSCGVCNLYQRSCYYEGVPKKRGPKKESLSALIKRIDGLEELLKSEKTPTPPGSDVAGTDFNEPTFHGRSSSSYEPCVPASPDTSPFSSLRGATFDSSSEISTTVNAEGLVDIYFNYFHCNPYEILDEAVTKHKLKTNQLPKSVLYAVCAVATGFSAKSGKSPSSHVSAETYAAWSQREIDPGDVSTDSCQALLLLVTAFAAMGNGKKAYVVWSQAVGIAMALELYSQPEKGESHIEPEDEARRRLFWTCYIMNVFVSTWLERPSLIDDTFIKADVQSSRQSRNWGGLTAEFPPVPKTDPRKHSKGPDDGLQKLVWISQILSEANRYLLLSDAASQSAYCQRHKILHDLDLWASSIGRGLEDPDHTQTLEGPCPNWLFVCRAVFHLVHILIHRPILPLRVNEPSGVKMIQHWVAEATETAFRHATAIIEQVTQARESGIVYLPPVIGFCVFTAGTVLASCAHYAEEQDPSQGLGVCMAPFASSPMSSDFFASSPDLFTRCLNELSMLGDVFGSARLYRLRLEELKAEHVMLLDGNVAGYVPTQSNRFFGRYSPTLRQKIQGFRMDETASSAAGSAKNVLTQSPVSVTHDDRFGKDGDSSMMSWSLNQPHHHGSKPSFTTPRPGIGVPGLHTQGHHRSFSDGLSQSYSFDPTSPLSQRQLPAWPGFPDNTPRQAPNQTTPGLNPSAQITSPVCQRDDAIAGVQQSWEGVKEYTGSEPLTYEGLAASVAPAGSTYQAQEGLAGSYVSFQNFSVS